MEIKLIPPQEAGQFCDNIRLSDFNKIQPYGVLVALDSNLRVMQHSANLATLLNTTSSQLLNTFITNYLKIDGSQKELESWLKEANSQYKRMYWEQEGNQISIWVWIHQTLDGILLEIESASKNEKEESDQLLDLAQKIVSTFEANNQIQDLNQLVQVTCENIQKITNFDRVIVYQFDKLDHSGLVIGEAREDYMESYLGLRFPANDVPQHVRAMYMDIPLRYIPTIHEKPIHLIPEINPICQRFLNLSHTNLRMVAPVHIQYLNNMKVSAATSVAILHDNRLWGLIACHHQEPKYVSVNLRFILTLISNTFSSQIIALERAADFYQHQRMLVIQETMTKNFTKENSLINALEHYHKALMKLVSAEGMSIFFQNNLLNFGETPSSDQVRSLAAWIQKHHPSKTYVTNTLPLQYKKSIHYKDKASGILAIKMTELEGDYLIFYRTEFIHQVIWAGNPKEALKYSKLDYSPRDSFERFMEIIINHSLPWLNHERNAAEFIRSLIVNKQLQDLLQLQALHDPLTGLLNRLYMEQSLAIEIHRAAREKQPLAVLLADLDYFKKINDQFGHQAGDFVLKEFAALLKKHFRQYDYLYRYGGEEFLLILPRMNETEAFEKANFLRQAVKNQALHFEGKLLPTIAISIGMSVYPTNGSSTHSLISAADAALYCAKENGRDRAVISNLVA